MFACPAPDCARKYKHEDAAREHAISYHQYDREVCYAIDMEQVPVEKLRRQRQTEAMMRRGTIGAVGLEECEICQEHIQNRGVVMPCGHATFCFECIERWERQTYGSSCPTCRQPIEGTTPKP